MSAQEIRFDCGRHADRGVLEVVPCVDGVPLTSLIDQFETGARMRPAGGAYGGLLPQFFRFGRLEDHFHGRPTGEMGPKTPVLGCACGDCGCWPLMAGITVTSAHVVWDSFEQPHRTARDYSGFGPFRFDRRQYDHAVQLLGTAISLDGA
ncbi:MULTISPECIES: hypothetical protein [unclassified Streptomyces]|uniref:hypothetical protein n=1 Tax=unclassified Streptomyces TaxID=2593676 RepID=UPI003431A40D